MQLRLTCACPLLQAQQPACREYYSKGRRAPATVSLSDVITVPEAFPLSEASVVLDVSHRRIGALVVTLTAAPTPPADATSRARSVVLKERGLGQLGDNMYMTTFSDSAAQPFPVQAVRRSLLTCADVLFGGLAVC